MSKNFVREINHIYNINKQDFNTNKPNDLLSTRAQNYIRTENRGYHCLTDNVKQTKTSNVRYTDTTANPNVNYNLLSVDNSQVSKNNTNTISALSLVSALEAKDEQIKKLKEEITSSKEKTPQIVFYQALGGQAIVCNTVLSEADDDGITYYIDCLITVSNTSFSPETRIARVLIYDPYKNFLFNDYEFDVSLHKPTAEVEKITFEEEYLVIKFGTQAASPFNGVIPLEVTIERRPNSK